VGTQASAAVITFDDNLDGQYFVGTVLSGGYKATGSAIGTNKAVDGSGQSNGTVHLDSWTNNSEESIWTLTKIDGGNFSLTGFDFASGYQNGIPDNATSVTLLGALTGGSTVTQTFAINQEAFQTLAVSSQFSNVKSVTFDAFGWYNRAAFDNIKVGAPVAAVPEPVSLGLLGLGLLGMGVARRHKGRSA
jgi:hypothetical protein